MTSTYFNWFRRLLILGAVVATGAFVSTAGAMPQDAATTNTATADIVRPPDVQDSATSLYATQAGLKADGLRWQGIAKRYEALSRSYSYPTALGLKAEGMRLQGTAQVYQDVQARPDVFERYAASHPYGTGVSLTGSLATRPPDVQDVAAGIGDTSSSSSIVSRPPDVQDATVAAQSSTTSQSDGFSWNSWGVGIGTGMGILLLLLLGIGFAMSRQHRHDRVQTA
jgi:hypothetical protein